ncbi:MAG: hypothetical protein DSM106950_17755 [Stigonema ocellatum SAG 48.90 = DSM 106950]|nr:hypothetical protein [Stigonema ocellatum SAG 48.90 = DSM 106950]
MSQLKLQQRLRSLPEDAKIMDAGGWFKPFPRATHVVDIMPWETRGARLQLEPLEKERFTKETWFQLDFLAPELKIPFDDKYFDFSICSQTLEDLSEPIYLIHELIRVSRAGYIEVPSRLHEQTIGVKDAFSDRLGHPHHHYIIDNEEGTLVFCSKEDSLSSSKYSYAIPFQLYRKVTTANSELAVTNLFWQDKFEVRFESGYLVERKAREFKESLSISWQYLLYDKAFRIGRRVKNLFLTPQVSTEEWWKKVVRMSQPYSEIKLT